MDLLNEKKIKRKRIHRLAKKVAKRTNLDYFDVDALLKVTAHEMIELLKKNQQFYWEGIGVFFTVVTDIGLTVRIRLSEEPYNKLNSDSKERRDEIIFE